LINMGGVLIRASLTASTKKPNINSACTHHESLQTYKADFIAGIIADFMARAAAGGEETHTRQETSLHTHIYPLIRRNIHAHTWPVTIHIINTLVRTHTHKHTHLEAREVCFGTNVGAHN
jgi:hypothetical protein